MDEKIKALEPKRDEFYKQLGEKVYIGKVKAAQNEAEINELLKSLFDLNKQAHEILNPPKEEAAKLEAVPPLPELEEAK